jgi:hypothetical protein
VESTSYWQDVMAADYAVPHDRGLSDLTEELVRGLASTNPQIRDALAYPTLATWLERGVYDDLLPGFGDGLCAGLNYGLGEDGTDTVFRRSFTALTLAEVIHRDNAEFLVHDEVVMRWGDRLATWLLRERDLRGYVADCGWAHAVAHGADAIGALARSRHCDAGVLRALLDVLADRIVKDTQYRWVHEEHDRVAHAVMTILHRNMLSSDELERWLKPVAATAAQQPLMHETLPEWPTPNVFNARGVLHVLLSQLAIGVKGFPIPGDDDLFGRPIESRADLLLMVTEAVRASQPYIYRPAPASS